MTDISSSFVLYIKKEDVIYKHIYIYISTYIHIYICLIMHLDLDELSNHWQTRVCGYAKERKEVGHGGECVLLARERGVYALSDRPTSRERSFPSCRCAHRLDKNIYIYANVYIV